MFKTFKEMKIWQDAMEIAKHIHCATDSLPKKEDYGFTSQIRRSALSISANIAEAFGREHKLDKLNFYFFARGSITETQSHLEYAKRVGYIDIATVIKIDKCLDDIYTSTNKVISSLKSAIK
jgi:four helix bundle protein